MLPDIFSIDPRLERLAGEAMARAAAAFSRIEAVTEQNQRKVLGAFIANRVSESHFAPTTGYGYGDRGREVLDRVFADAMGAPDALVRHSIVSGTHAITIALFGVLRPGDTLLAATGAPYDTLEGVIGEKTAAPGSLREFGVRYREVPLDPAGRPDPSGIVRALEEEPSVRMVHIQRSRGYSLRPSLRVEDIAPIVEISKRKAPDAIVMVDNCYGEFVEREEPLAVGADIIAGSLIKNPGGGIAPTGGYIAGRRDLVELCSYRLTTPGTGREIGCTLGNNRELFMGAFHAPHVAGEALKTAVFASALFSQLGFGVTPTVEEKRGDIIQVMLLEKPENLIAFCKGVQKGAPVDSFVVPEPSDMPGYDSQVIMAAGAFTLGSSIELSADAPLREPYAAWMQGGLNYHSGQLGMLLAAQEMANEGLLNLQ